VRNEKWSRREKIEERRLGGGFLKKHPISLNLGEEKGGSLECRRRAHAM
jgi:hypothetical protein